MRRSESNSVYAATEHTRACAAQDIVVCLGLDLTVRASRLFRPKLVNIMVLIGRSCRHPGGHRDTPRGDWTDGSSQKLCLLRITPSRRFSSRLRCTPRGVYIQGMQKRAISFRFDQADLDRWKVIAERSGLTLSEWIRRRVNGGPTTTRVHRDRGVGENERPTSVLPRIEEVLAQPEKVNGDLAHQDSAGDQGIRASMEGADQLGGVSGGDHGESVISCKHGARPDLCRYAACREQWRLTQ